MGFKYFMVLNEKLQIFINDQFMSFTFELDKTYKTKNEKVYDDKRMFFCQLPTT